MPLAEVASFWAVSFLFVMTPGADWAYAMTAGLRHRSIVPAVVGLLSGHLLATAIVAAGVAALLARTPGVLATLTLAGAAYLVWLGVGTVRSSAEVEVDPEAASGSTLGRLVAGVAVSGLNPKVILLFLALLPQFTTEDAQWPVAAQIVVLGLIHTASCAVVYTAVGLGARRVLRARPSAARLVTRLSGAAMVTIGALLLTEHLIM